MVLHSMYVAVPVSVTCLPQNTTQFDDGICNYLSSFYTYQSDACSTIVGTCSLRMRLLKASGSGQSKQRVDGKDWLITLCNWWSNKAVRVTKAELTKTNKLNSILL